MTGTPPPSGDALRAATQTSHSLLARVKAREPTAWSQLVELYAPLVHSWCRRSQLHDADVADVFQEVFQTVSLNIERFRKEKPQDTFRGWLRTITRHKVVDHFRRQQGEPLAAGGSAVRQRMAAVPAPEKASDIDSQLAAKDAAEKALFHRALEQIREQFQDKTWRAFWRTVMDGVPPREVGDELQMSPGAVRVAKSRVLQRLREQLGDWR
jgi:RNA polymerase sigma-70 factor (ECF subfamily)